jgi:glycosyltransferase involved in cell wall biosynthesis
VVPNGVEKDFLNSPAGPRGPWLVCVATITAIKRVLELAEAAARAKTPVWIVGKPFVDSDPYAQRFLAVAKQNPNIIRYEGPIQDRAKLAEVYSTARGFVLLSAFESRSIAAEEAAACGCPLLLSDLPWAKSVFGATASYCPITHVSGTAACLRAFYDQAPTGPKPLRPKSWAEVGQQLKGIYEACLNAG